MTTARWNKPKRDLGIMNLCTFTPGAVYSSTRRRPVRVGTGLMV